MGLITIAVAYNAIMCGVDVAILAFIRKKSSVKSLFLGIVLLEVIAFMVPYIYFKQALFPVLHLFAYGVFFHGFVILAGSAVVFRKRIKHLSLFCALCAVLLEIIAVDAFVIEPKWLEITDVRMESAKISQPMTIALVADIQTDEIGEYEEQVIEQIMKRKPDLILFAGDYIQVGDRELREQRQSELNRVLRKANFRAPLGTYAVRGDIDPSNWFSIFEGVPVTAVPKSQTYMHRDFFVTGLTLNDSRDPNTKVKSQDGFHIVLGHSPNFALGDIQADLLVAGHTHGGQVQIPFIGPPVTLSLVPMDWAHGVTKLDNNRTLVVSRGIGMERGVAPRLRFFCRPQLIFIELVPQS
ncbi:MAG: metallophosphoesterase family protein [Candidatus Lindowbacteria bacterium]|nr:metallophosphoesterase family protein [Candidatus Lindowbacteria bacterium]